MQTTYELRLHVMSVCFVFLNQAHAGRRPACAWFLEITFVPPKYVCVCVCVCVCESTPEAINN